MTAHSNSDGFNWYESLDEAKSEYSVVKCYSPLQFFQLKGKTTTMIAENMEPIAGLLYCYLAPQDADKRYYIRQSHGYTLQEFYFYAPFPRELSFSGESQAIETLRNRIQDGQVWLLFNQEQVEDMTAKLISLFKSHYHGEGKVPYNTYLKLLEENLRLEDYKNYATELTGYKTVCKGFNDRIAELWQSCKK